MGPAMGRVHRSSCTEIGIVAAGPNLPSDATAKMDGADMRARNVT